MAGQDDCGISTDRFLIRWICEWLNDATNEGEFYNALGRAIRAAHDLNTAELEWLANVASKPYKRARGQPNKNARLKSVFLHQVLTIPAGKTNRKTRLEAYEDIEKEYSITRERARELYDESIKSAPPGLAKIVKND